MQCLDTVLLFKVGTLLTFDGVFQHLAAQPFGDFSAGLHGGARVDFY